MKNRLHDKKAGIPILVSLILISVAELIFRVLVLKERVLVTPNLGEQSIVLILATVILVMTLKNKDRLCYICTGAWLTYFVLDQLFELPGVISYLITYSDFTFLILLSPVLHLISMICTVVIGILLVEYMNDGTICNRAFNLFCLITILATLGAIVLNVYNLIQWKPLEIVLAIFNNVYCIIMLFYFTFFAYDSAKKQLSKVNFDK